MNGLSPEVLWYLEDRGIAVPEDWQEPLIRTPEPRDVPGARFNPEKVDRVLKAFHALRHTQGALAGSPLDPDPWQVAYIIAPVFGWEHQNDDGDWVRIITEVWIEVSRKNGKSTLSGGLGLYLMAADKEPGAQVVAAATTREQAGFCFAPIAGLVENAPMLKKNFQSYRSAKKILQRTGSSYFQAIGSVAEAIHGANIHGAIVDEVHLHKTPDLIEAIETGTGSRRQPLIVFITTADDGKPNSIYARKRKLVEQIADGVIDSKSVYGVIWAAARTERELVDPYSEETIKRANPGYGVSPGKQYLLKAAESSKNSPAEYNNYLRLHLGVRTKQVTRFIPLADWDFSAGMIDEAELVGKSCFCGIDLGSVSDLTAFSMTFPDDNHDFYRTIWRFWTPRDNMASLNARTGGAAAEWEREGFLTVTDGNVIDNLFVVKQILADAKKYRMLRVGYDKYHAQDVVRRLEDYGIETQSHGQGHGDTNGPLKEMLSLLKQGKYIHGGNPVMRWMVDNLVVNIDAYGNVKPDKKSANDKIDGVSAAIMSLDAAMTERDGSILNALSTGG